MVVYPHSVIISRFVNLDRVPIMRTSASMSAASSRALPRSLLALALKEVRNSSTRNLNKSTSATVNRWNGGLYGPCDFLGSVLLTIQAFVFSARAQRLFLNVGQPVSVVLYE